MGDQWPALAVFPPRRMFISGVFSGVAAEVALDGLGYICRMSKRECSKAVRAAKPRGRAENLTPWGKGVSGNPAGRPPRIPELTEFELCRDPITARAVGMTLGGWIRQRRAEILAARTVALASLSALDPAKRVHASPAVAAADLPGQGSGDRVILATAPAPASLLDLPPAGSASGFLGRVHLPRRRGRR